MHDRIIHKAIDETIRAAVVAYADRETFLLALSHVLPANVLLYTHMPSHAYAVYKACVSLGLIIDEAGGLYKMATRVEMDPDGFTPYVVDAVFTCHDRSRNVFNYYTAPDFDDRVTIDRCKLDDTLAVMYQDDFPNENLCHKGITIQSLGRLFRSTTLMVTEIDRARERLLNSAVRDSS